MSLSPNDASSPAPFTSVDPWQAVSFGPPEPWVDIEPADSTFAAKDGAHSTILAWERQVHLPESKSFHFTSNRVETQQSVQNSGQWHLDFDLRFNKLKLHWLRVVRGGETIDHLKREQIRLIQRETKLERHQIDGNWTLLVILSDLRPGDIIESAYTFTFSHPLSAGACEQYYGVPAVFAVAKYRLSVVFAADNTRMASMTSKGVKAREDVELPEGLTKWTWRGSQPKAREFEPNVYDHHRNYLWIQVSDRTWPEIAERIATRWEAMDLSLPSDLYPKPDVVDAQSVVALIRSIQDTYRYLSLDLETGGWIPAMPAETARRRYGDCKDLTWFCCSILRRWGVRCRPMIVATGLRQAVGELLPAAQLFNHAIIEVSLDGITRWFDLTRRNQGGSFASQPVSTFKLGLPVDRSASALEKEPEAIAPNVYLIRETLFVDTRPKEASVVEVRVWAEGFQAERIRNDRANAGPDAYAKNRAEAFGKRFLRSIRFGSLEWRDDRERNVIELVETYEVRDFFQKQTNDKRALANMPITRISSTVFTPDENKPRTFPWAMAFPYEVAHRFCIKTHASTGQTYRRLRWTAPGFTAAVEVRFDPQEWQKTTWLKTTSEEVSPSDVPTHAQILDKVKRNSGWGIFLSWDQAKMKGPEDLGKLPPIGSSRDSYIAEVNFANIPEAGPDDRIDVPGVRTAPIKRTFNSPKMLVFWVAFSVLIGVLQTCK